VAGTAGTIIRVSTSKQLEGTSPEKQLEGIRALANEQGFSIAEEHTWIVAESGSLRDRTGFHQARQAAASGQLSRVYVYSVDRLGRNLLEMLLFLRDLQDLGLECWEAEKRRPLVWDDFILQIEGAVAGKERQEIFKRTQDGLVRAIRPVSTPGESSPTATG
jgi:DNA invertase Pin-like site-specific DNA recombinase